MADNKISMPAGFGGLMRYDDTNSSRFQLKPAHVIVFVILIMVFVIGLKLFFPVK